MITLESLLNNEEPVNVDESINLEDYSFDLSDYTIECSDIMCDINTLEAASIVCEDENKKNIFKQMIEKIRKFFERLIEFFKSFINKFKQRKIDKRVDAIISKIKKNEKTQFVYSSSPYVDVLYEEKFDKNDVETYLDGINAFISNIKKSIEDLESHIVKNDKAEIIEDMFTKIVDIFNDFDESIKKSKFAAAIEKCKKDSDEYMKNYNIYQGFDKIPSVSDEKTNLMSKDELINRLSWIKTVYIVSYEGVPHLESQVLKIKWKCEDLYKRFSDFEDTYLSKMLKSLQKAVEMVYRTVSDIGWLMIRLCDEVGRIDLLIPYPHNS